MFDIETSLKEFPIITFSKGDVILLQGEKTDSLYFLLEGEVSVAKDGFEVAHRSQKGSVYGEMSMLLAKAHSSTVRCVTDSKLYCVKDPKKVLENNSEVIWHIGKILSMRLEGLNEYLIDVKSRYEGQDKQDVSTKEKSSGREKIVNEILQILQVQ